MVSHGREAMVYWLCGGLCSDVEFMASGLFVQGKIEARCCPDVYELPPQIPWNVPSLGSPHSCLAEGILGSKSEDDDG